MIETDANMSHLFLLTKRWFWMRKKWIVNMLIQPFWYCCLAERLVIPITACSAYDLDTIIAEIHVLLATKNNRKQPSPWRSKHSWKAVSNMTSFIRYGWPGGSTYQRVHWLECFWRLKLLRTHQVPDGDSLERLYSFLQRSERSCFVPGNSPEFAFADICRASERIFRSFINKPAILPFFSISCLYKPWYYDIVVPMPDN